MSFLRRSAFLLFLSFFVSGLLCELSAAPAKKKKKRAFLQGQSSTQAGVGYPSLIKPNTDTLMYFGTVEKKASPPFFVRYEFGVTDNLGVGGMIGMAFSEATYTDNTDPDNVNGFKYSHFISGLRAAWHFTIKSPKFDPYAVGFVGANLTKISSFGPSNPLEVSKKVFLWSVHVGANYYFLDKIGAFAEVGYGISVANAGLVLKF